jgi:crossover junction endodeoxyribonuclease RusA
MIQISIPDTHPSINKWVSNNNPWARAKMKKEWEELVYYCCKQQKIKPIEGQVAVGLIYYFPTNRRRDIDNYTPKFILDGLVKAGIIEDDSTKTIVDLSWKILYEKGRSETVVTITEVES